MEKLGAVFRPHCVAPGMTIIQPIRCFPHPDGSMSVVDSPDILCGEDQHIFLLVVAFLAFATFLLGFFLWYIHSIYILPVRSLTDKNYAPAIKFIIYRFHNGAWWWGGVFILRAISVATVTLINPSYPYTQTLILALVLLFFLCLQIGAWPWRTHGLNFLDASVTVCVLAMVISASSLAANGGDVDRETRTRVGYVCLGFWMAAVSIVGVYFCWQLADFLVNDTTFTTKLGERFRGRSSRKTSEKQSDGRGGALAEEVVSDEGVSTNATNGVIPTDGAAGSRKNNSDIKSKSNYLNPTHFFRTRRESRRETRNGILSDRIVSIVEGIETLAPADPDLQYKKIFSFVSCLNDVDQSRLERVLYLFLVDLVPGELESVASFFSATADERRGRYSLLERLRVRRCRGNPDAFDTQQKQLMAMALAKQAMANGSPGTSALLLFNKQLATFF